MNSKKVIKGLDVCLKNIDQPDCPNDCPYLSDCSKYENRVVFQPLMRDALTMLKEQNGLMLALEQSNAVNEYLNAEVERLNGLLKEQEAKCCITDRGAYCPLCGKDLYLDDNPHFCGVCGQAVKWE